MGKQQILDKIESTCLLYVDKAQKLVDDSSYKKIEPDHIEEYKYDHRETVIEKRKIYHGSFNYKGYDFALEFGLQTTMVADFTRYGLLNKKRMENYECFNQFVFALSSPSGPVSIGLVCSLFNLGDMFFYPFPITDSAAKDLVNVLDVFFAFVDGLSDSMSDALFKYHAITD